MKEQKILLEVSNNKTILINIINCVQKNNITINEFRAEESNAACGHISIVLEGEKENIDALIKQLEQLKDVEHITGSKTTLPSNELQDSFEE